MPDNVKGVVGQAVADVSEAVIHPVAQEVKQDVTEGIESIIGGGSHAPQDPNMQAQKKLEEEKRKQWALSVIERNRQLDEQLKKIRQAKEQQRMQQNQEVKQEKRVKQFKVVQKQQLTKQIQIQRSQSERKVGKGLGG